MSSNQGNGPPGLQYPKLPSDLSPDLSSAVRNIIDNLFYIREQITTTPTATLSPVQTREIQRIVGQQIVTVLNTVNNVTQNIINNFAGNATIVGTHNLRLTTYGSASEPVGTLFYESDRHVLYVIEPTPNHWQFVAGIQLGLEASQPADLGTNDTGFLYFATDTTTLFVWDGTTFVSISVGGSVAGTRVITITPPGTWGSSTPIPTGIVGFARVPWNCTIIRATLISDVNTNMVMDVWFDAATYPPTDADSITGGNEPELVGADEFTDTTLTSWSPALTAGGWIGANVDSNSAAGWAQLQLLVELT